MQAHDPWCRIGLPQHPRVHCVVQRVFSVTRHPWNCPIRTVRARERCMLDPHSSDPTRPFLQPGRRGPPMERGRLPEHAGSVEIRDKIVSLSQCRRERVLVGRRMELTKRREKQLVTRRRDHQPGTPQYPTRVGRPANLLGVPTHTAPRVQTIGARDADAPGHPVDIRPRRHTHTLRPPTPAFHGQKSQTMLNEALPTRRAKRARRHRPGCGHSGPRHCLACRPGWCAGRSPPAPSRHRPTLRRRNARHTYPMHTEGEQLNGRSHLPGWCVTWGFVVGGRGFEPLTPSASRKINGSRTSWSSLRKRR